MQRKLVFAAACFLCMVVYLRSNWIFDGTEFGGGTLCLNNDRGFLAFALALILILRYPAVAAGSALVGCFLSAPLYLYLVFPRPFRQVWGGEWKVQSPEIFVYEPWWIAGILLISFLAGISCHPLATHISTFFRKRKLTSRARA